MLHLQLSEVKILIEMIFRICSSLLFSIYDDIHEIIQPEKVSINYSAMQNELIYACISYVGMQ